MKPKLYIMIGISGSGKSTIANSLNANVISSDKLREELFGDINEQGKNDELFKEVHERIGQSLIDGKDTVYDATSLSMKKRRHFLQHELRNIDCEKIAMVVATPIDRCLQNDRNRHRTVGKEVIFKQLKKFNFPLYQEGFDRIEIKYSYILPSIKECLKHYEFLNEFDQENSHHKLTLGKHMWKTGYYLYRLYGHLYPNEDFPLCVAGRLHDIGKPFVKSFKNSKGEITEQAHYYCHENVSAYIAMFHAPLFSKRRDDVIKVCQLISMHMKPYMIKKEKTKQKYLKFLGEEFYSDLIKLHKADKFAH